jgi:hypothetical protein
MGENENVEQREEHPMMIRANIVPESFNETERTVDVVFATETPVSRYVWGDYQRSLVNEILDCQPNSVRLQRFANGIPLLDNHNRWEGTKSVLGICKNPRFEGRTMVATIRFSKKQAGEDAMNEVRDGIVTTVSVGYNTWEYQINKKEGTPDEYRAIDWEPMEISLAPIPADSNSVIRSQAQGLNTLNKMGEDQNLNQPTPQVPETRAADPATAVTVPVNPASPAVPAGTREEGARAERERVASIMTAVRAAGMSQAEAEAFITNGTDINAVRESIIAGLASRQPQIDPTNASARGDEALQTREALQSSMLIRAGQTATVTPEDRTRAADFNGMRMLDIARNCLDRAGINHRGLSELELYGRAITSSTSDFPVLLQGVINRVLLAEYTITPDTWRRFCHIGSVSDFRNHDRLRLGSMSRLDKVAENGEYKNKGLSDATKESIFADTYGNIINVSRKMLINDDLGGFLRLAAQLARAAKRSIELDVYSLFALNSGFGPTMADGNPLFDAAHLNIGTGSALSVIGLDADRVVMASQKEPGANDFLDLRPSVLLLPIGLGGQARVINAATYDPDTANKLQMPNRVVGLFSDIVDTPRLTGTKRYLFANPSEEPVFEVAFLNGQQEPYTEQDMPFNVDGMSWKIRLDYGFGAIGHRGAVMNAGQ